MLRRQRCIAAQALSPRHKLQCQRGAITRAVQVQTVATTVWELVKQGAAGSLHAFWDGLEGCRGP